MHHEALAANGTERAFSLFSTLIYFDLEKGCWHGTWDYAVQDKRCLVRSGSIPSILPVHRVAVGVLPCDPRAAVAVLISSHTALGELLSYMRK